MMAHLLTKRIYVGSGGLRVSHWSPEKPSNDLTLVLLHEGLGCIASWKDLPAWLAETCSCDVVAYDRLGHGRSDPAASVRAPDYMHHEARSVLPEVIAQTASGPVILIGHSDGGSIALIHAAQEPERCRAVVSIAAHVMVESMTLRGIRQARTLFREPSWREKLVQLHGQKTNDLFQAWSGIWLSDAFSDWNLAQELRDIRCPVLAVQGRDDIYGSLTQMAWITQLSAGSVDSYLLPGVGHAPHLEDPARVMPLIAAFILNAIRQ